MKLSGKTTFLGVLIDTPPFRYLDDTRKWFRTYKIPDGKPENNFAFDGAYKDKAFADKTIADTYVQWQCLIRGKFFFYGN